MPFGWRIDQVQAARVAVSPSRLAGEVSVDALTLSQITGDGNLAPVAPLSPTVVGRTATVAPVVAASRYTAGSEHGWSGYLLVRVADALGYALDGITTTMTLPAETFAATCMECRTVSGVSGSPGPHYTGLSWLGWETHRTGLPAGTTTSVTTEDRAMLPVEMSLDF